MISAEVRVSFEVFGPTVSDLEARARTILDGLIGDPVVTPKLRLEVTGDEFELESDSPRSWKADVTATW